MRGSALAYFRAGRAVIPPVGGKTCRGRQKGRGMTAILLVDDDGELAEMIKAYLEREGLVVGVVPDGERGVVAALSGRFELVVLDVMMPGMGGLAALRAIRQKSEVPIIMLTAQGDDVDRVVGLELGADDYVPKPCTPRELLARIRAIMRRVRPAVAAGEEPVVLAVGGLALWPEQRRAVMAGEAVVLTSAEFNLLEVLARHAGQPVAKDELALQGLGRPLARFDRSIDVHMSSIRQKLGLLPDGRSPIQTVFRRGYMLVKD